jgi:hypothetical protein
MKLTKIILLGLGSIGLLQLGATSLEVNSDHSVLQIENPWYVLGKSYDKNPHETDETVKPYLDAANMVKINQKYGDKTALQQLIEEGHFKGALVLMEKYNASFMQTDISGNDTEGYKFLHDVGAARAINAKVLQAIFKANPEYRQQVENLLQKETCSDPLFGGEFLARIPREFFVTHEIIFQYAEQYSEHELIALLGEDLLKIYHHHFQVLILSVSIRA